MAKTLESRIAALEERNARVELDKAWEVSWQRKLSVAILTYVVVVSYLYFVVGIEPWITALVPVLGYLLSTFSIAVVKKRWIENKKG